MSVDSLGDGVPPLNNGCRVCKVFSCYIPHLLFYINSKAEIKEIHYYLIRIWRGLSMSKILEEVKHKVGPSAEYEYFELDILDAINEAFAILNQLGAGPEDGFTVTPESEWEEYTEDKVLLGLIKKYVYKKTLLTFDTPNNGNLIGSLKDQIADLEWRINIHVDP